MAFFDTLPQRARSALDDIRAAFAPAPAEDAAPGAFYGASTEAQEIFNLIEARIEDARDAAAERGDRPTLEDYRQACVAFGETEQGKALAKPDAEHPNGRWNPRVYSNLGGQDRGGAGYNLSGFALSEQPKRVMSNLMNLDSDGAIGDFYTNIDFTGANLKNAYVDPATSFNEEIAKAGNLDGLTFNNMSADDPAFVFGAGKYTNIKMTNIQGGEIIFGDNSRVKVVEIQGTSATVTMGDYAKVSDVRPMDDFSMMNLSMGKGSMLDNADLTNATISQASEFGHGATFQNVTLGSNISGVDFSGVTFNNVTFNGSNLNDTSFEGATLNGVAFNDVDPATLDLSGVQRMNGVTVNGTSIASAMELQMMQLASSVKPFGWEANKFTPPAAPAAQMATTEMDLSAQAPTKTMIAFGGDVPTLSDALSGGYNPGKDGIGKVQPAEGQGMVPGMPGSNA